MFAPPVGLASSIETTAEGGVPRTVDSGRGIYITRPFALEPQDLAAAKPTQPPQKRQPQPEESSEWGPEFILLSPLLHELGYEQGRTEIFAGQVRKFQKGLRDHAGAKGAVPAATLGLVTRDMGMGLSRQELVDVGSVLGPRGELDLSEVLRLLSNVDLLQRGRGLPPRRVTRAAKRPLEAPSLPYKGYQDGREAALEEHARSGQMPAIISAPDAPLPPSHQQARRILSESRYAHEEEGEGGGGPSGREYEEHYSGEWVGGYPDGYGLWDEEAMLNYSTYVHIW